MTPESRRAPRLLVLVTVLLAPATSAAALQEPDATPLVRDLVIEPADEHLFSRIGAMTIDGRGRLWVIDHVERAIFVFDDDGRFVRRVGRRGEGPGEFESPGASGWRDGEVWVSDRRHRRVTWFDEDGTHLRTERWMLPPIRPAFSSAPVSLVLGDGTALAQPGLPASALGRGEITSVPIVWISEEGEVLDTVAEVRRENTVVMLEFGNVMSFSGQPFGAGDQWSAFADGSGVAVLRPRVATQGETTTFEVARIGIDGQPVYTRRYEAPARPVRAEEVDSAIAAIAEPRRDRLASLRQLERQIRDQLYVPDHHVPVNRVLAAEDGRVFVRMSVERDGLEFWYAIAPDGELEGMISVDAEASLRWTDGRTFWAVHLDQFDVPMLVRYRRDDG